MLQNNPNKLALACLTLQKIKKTKKHKSKLGAGCVYDLKLII